MDDYAITNAATAQVGVWVPSAVPIPAPANSPQVTKQIDFQVHIVGTLALKDGHRVVQRLQEAQALVDCKHSLADCYWHPVTTIKSFNAMGWTLMKRSLWCELESSVAMKVSLL